MKSEPPRPDIPLSEAKAPAPTATLGFFRGRLVRTLAHRGQDVEEDTGRTDLFVPPLMKQHLGGEMDFVPFSQQAARHLYTSQGGSSSIGLLVACELTLAGGPALALMKLEEEQGVIVEDDIVDGRPTLNVTVEEHLLLTDNTRVFKAGVFWMDGPSLKGYVSDEQQGARVDIADYFLGEFLGCRLEVKPDLVTRSFYEGVTGFISARVADPVKKLNYGQALHTEVASNRKRIDPVQFAADHFDDTDQQPLLDSLVDRGVPRAAFRKDTSRLGPRPATTRLRTASGITISGRSEEIDERVESIVIGNERVIVIHDTLTDVA